MDHRLSKIFFQKQTQLFLFLTFLTKQILELLTKQLFSKLMAMTHFLIYPMKLLALHHLIRNPLPSPLVLLNTYLHLKMYNINITSTLQIKPGVFLKILLAHHFKSGIATLKLFMAVNTQPVSLLIVTLVCISQQLNLL